MKRTSAYLILALALSLLASTIFFYDTEAYYDDIEMSPQSLWLPDSGTYMIDDPNAQDLPFEPITSIYIDADYSGPNVFELPENLRTAGINTGIHFSKSFEISIEFRMEMQEGLSVGSDYELSNDSATSINGVHQGVGTGALVIQTSRDHANWRTEFIPVYVEDTVPVILTSKELEYGRYVRVMFAYEVFKGSFLLKEYHNVLEYYEFFAIVSDPYNVTFHNLTLDDGSDESDISIRHFDTMKSNSATVTGFEIRNLKESACNLSISRNGIEIQSWDPYRFTDPGKYEIKIYNDMTGWYRDCTLFVQPLDYLIQQLFSEEPFSGAERIESYGDVPAFKHGCALHFKQSETVQTMDIKVVNSTSKTSANYDTASDLVITFANGFNTVTIEPKSNSSYGDVITIKYSFQVVDETDIPLPHVNLDAMTSRFLPYDLPYSFYTVKTSTAGNGSFYWLFPDRDSAYQFAYLYQLNFADRFNLEWNNNEYGSWWSISNAINQWCEDNIELQYRGLSTGTQSYNNLDLNIGGEWNSFFSDPVMEGGASTWSLKNFDLPRNAVLFASAEIRDSMRHSELPIISSGYMYSATDLPNGESRRNLSTYFIADSEHLFSSEISVSDGTRSVMIKYGSNVETVLLKEGFEPGPITISESSPGGKIEYGALFLPNGVPTLSGTITVDGKAYDSVDGLELNGRTIELDLDDPYGDTYANLFYSPDGTFDKTVKPTRCSLDRASLLSFDEPGTYMLLLINCVDAVTTITIQVEGGP